MKKLESINVNFFRNNMNSVTDFDNYEILAFHFEEGISIPYTGTLDLVTKKNINLGKIDLDYLYVKICYKVEYNYIDNSTQPDERCIWALIKDIRLLLDIDHSTSDRILYHYQLELESPLARLENESLVFEKKDIPEILRTLLDVENPKSDAYYQLLKIEDSKITNKNKDSILYDTKDMVIQRGQEETLTFFNRILIGYGINYIFDFNKEKGAILIFSRDCKFKNNYEKECTNNSFDICNNKKIYFKENDIKKQSVQFKKAQNIAKKLKDSWITLESDRTDLQGKKERNIKFFYRNLCIHGLKATPVLTVQNVQDIRITPGLILNSEIDSIKSQYIVNKVITDIKTDFSNNLKTYILRQKVNNIELVEHSNYKELEDKLATDYFEFDSRSELGCLIGQDDNNFFTKYYSEKNIDVIQAITCDKYGKINKNNTARCENNTAENDDLFYAKQENEGSVIRVHALIETNNSEVKQIMQGQKILILQKGGKCFLYSYIPKAFDIYNDKLSNINQEILNINNTSISLQNYKDNYEYIYTLLKSDIKRVDDAILLESFTQGDASIHDDIYLREFRIDVIDLHNKYINSKRNLDKALEILNKTYSSNNSIILSTYYSNQNKKLKSDAPKELLNVESCKQVYTDCCSNLWLLAIKIVTRCHVNFIKKNQESILEYNNNNGFYFNSNNGEFTISAKSINITGLSDIKLNSKNILINATKKIKSQVGFSSIETTQEKTAISTGSTISCTVPYKSKDSDASYDDGKNKSDMLSSKLTVATFSGISANAYNISLTGNNGLSLTGPLKSGISLGYGTVKLVGSEIKLQTQGKLEQYKNIYQTSKNFLMDIIGSARNLKNNQTFQIFNSVFDLPVEIYNIGNKAKSIYKNHKSLKKDREILSSGKIKNFYKEDITATGGDKARAVYDYIDNILQLVFNVLDIVTILLKRIFMKFMQIDYDNKKREQEKEDKIKGVESKEIPKFILMTPFNKEKNLLNKIEQIELYISHAKMANTLIAAGFKASQGKFRIFPAVSEFTITSNTAELKSQAIAFEQSEEGESITAPAGSITRNYIRQTLTATTQTDATQTDV